MVLTSRLDTLVGLVAVPATDGPAPSGMDLTAHQLALSLTECQFRFSTRTPRVQARSERPEDQDGHLGGDRTERDARRASSPKTINLAICVVLYIIVPKYSTAWTDLR